MKFQGTARAKKGPENGPIAAASAAAFWPPARPVFATVFVAATGCAPLLGLGDATANDRAPRTTRADAAAQGEGKVQTSGSRALSNPDHDVAHRLAGLDRFMRRHDGAEIEALRHVVDELAALEHARDVGGRAGALLLRHQVHQEKLQRDAVLEQELEWNRRLGRAAAVDRHHAVRREYVGQ